MLAFDAISSSWGPCLAFTLGHGLAGLAVQHPAAHHSMTIDAMMPRPGAAKVVVPR